MRVIIVNDAAYVTGGAGNVALTEAILLAQQNVDVLLFSGFGPVDDRLIKSGVKVVVCDSKDILTNKNRIEAFCQGLWNRKAKRRFEEVLSNYSVEDTVVHYHAWTKALSASVLSVTQKYGYKIVITTHDYFSFCPNGGLYNYVKGVICDKSPMSLDCIFCNCDSRNVLQKYWRVARQFIQERYLWRHENISIIAISELTKTLFLRYSKKVDNIYVLKNPIELPEIKQELEGTCDVFVFMGRLSKEKGVDLFCRAVTDLGVKGVVLGDGYQRCELARKYENIEFTGWVSGDKKISYLKNARALVFPSLWYEGAPLTIVEMLSRGIPCIVPDKCAASECVTHGFNGYLFKIGDIESLKESIKMMTVEESKRMSRNIINSFDSYSYSESAHSSSLMEIYRDILSHKL